MNDRAFRRAQISYFDTQILRMKALRNTFVPIFVLPPELLITIFTYVRDMCHDNISSLSVAQWMSVTRVCTHWRTISINHPPLWCRLSFAGQQDPKHIAMMIQRSKSAPLLRIHVALRFSYIYHQTLLALLSKFDRLQQLDMLTEHTHWSTAYLNKISGANAPILKSLRLESVDLSASVKFSFPDLFSGGTPSLRHLDLTGFSVRPHPSLTSGLTSFHLHRDDLAVDPATGDMYLFEVLEQMPNLREFVFKTPIFAADPIPGRVVKMPRLEKFTFEGTHKFLAMFLERFAVPVSAFLELECHIDYYRTGGAGLNYHEIFRRLASSLSSSWLFNSPVQTEGQSTESHSTTIRCVQATDNSDTDAGLRIFDFCAWLEDTDFVHILADPSRSTPQYRFQNKDLKPNLTMRVHGLAPWMSIRYLLSSFPLRNLRSIFLDVQVRKKDLAILGRMPFLRSMMVTEQSAADFLHYVVNDPVMLRHQSRKRKNKTVDADGKQQPPPKHFSKLVHLGFSNVDFGLFDYEMDGIEDEAIDVDVFLEYLAFRKQTTPIKRIRIESCDNLIKEEIQLMGALADQVLWDERVRVIDDYDWREERGIKSDVSEDEASDDGDGDGDGDGDVEGASSDGAGRQHDDYTYGYY